VLFSLPPIGDKIFQLEKGQPQVAVDCIILFEILGLLGEVVMALLTSGGYSAD